MASTSLFSFPEVRPTPRPESPAKAHAEYYKQMNAWCDAAEEEGIALQNEITEFKDIGNALDYLSGFQWKEAMPSYRARPVNNEFLMMFWETVGLLTDLRPMFTIKDIGGGSKYSDVERVLNDLAKGWVTSQKFSRTMGFCTMFGMLTSAPAKLYWDPQARGLSGDPEDGDVSFYSCAPSSILRLGAGEYDIQTDECVIERKVKTLDWFKRAYPTMGKFVTPEMDKSSFTLDTQARMGVSPQLFPPLSAGMSRLLGRDEGANAGNSVYPKAEYQEFWRNNDSVNETNHDIQMGRGNYAYVVPPKKKLYPRGQLIARSKEGVILWDQPNPYWTRRKPYASLGLLGVPWQQYAMSVVKPWMSQQDILNQMMAGVLNTVKKAVNPALMAAKSAINPAAMKAIDASKPGLKITYSQNAPHPPSWQAPPVLPNYVLQVVGMVTQSMKQSSGASAAGDGMAKKQAPSGDSLEKYTNAKNTPIRFMAKNAESFLDDIGVLWIGCTLQFKDAGARMEDLGAAGLTTADMDNNPASLVPEGINSEAYVRRFHFKTEPGTLLVSQQQDKVQVAFALRKGRDLSRSQLFKILKWNINEKENDEQLAKEAQSMAAAGPQAKGKK